MAQKSAKNPSTSTAPCCFLSIVGRQIFGTLNPLLAVMGEGIRLSSVHLLATPEVRETSDKIAAFCHQRGLPCSVYPVSDVSDLHSNAAASVLAAQLAEKHERKAERCILNISGGTNALIAAAVLHALPLDLYLVQSIREAAVLTDTRDFSCRVCKLGESLPTATILDLQGVPYSHYTPEKTGVSLLDVCTRYDLKLPENCLKYVRINDIPFDMVWSGRNNKLHFLFNALKANLPTRTHTEKNAQSLALLRDLTHWAQTRGRTQHLFDRNLHAITDNANVYEHLRGESGGKIDVIYAEKASRDPSALRVPLEKCLAADPMRPSQPFQPKKRTPLPVADGTLITVLSSPPQATLSVISTHKPKTLLLGYTPDLRQTAHRIEQQANNLGLKEIQTFECHISGADIQTCLQPPRAGAQPLVHVSPGSKGQGAHLTCWAAQHDCPVWVFNLPRNTSERLDAPAPSLPMDTTDSVELLRALGHTVSYAYHLEGTAQGKAFASYRLLLDFLGNAFAHSPESPCFVKAVSIDGTKLGRSNSKKSWALHCPDGTVHCFRMQGGEWLENLAALAFARAGATQMHVRVRIERTPESKAYLQQCYGKDADIFLRDMDVLGSYGGRNFLVSCKSNPHSDIATAAREVAAMAPLINRFTLPLLCHLGCNASFLWQSEDARRMSVRVLGWRDLCQPDKLREYLEELRNIMH